MRVGGSLLRHTALPITYLGAGRPSWWSFAGTVADRMGLGRGSWGGRWIAVAAALLVLAAAALAVAVVWRTLVAGDPAPAAEAADADRPLAAGARRLRRVPRLAWAIAAVAVLNALAWSLLTPAFQVPDEQTHFAYAQLIGERGRPPGLRRGDRFARAGCRAAGVTIVLLCVAWSVLGQLATIAYFYG